MFQPLNQEFTLMENFNEHRRNIIGEKYSLKYEQSVCVQDNHEFERMQPAFIITKHNTYTNKFVIPRRGYAFQIIDGVQVSMDMKDYAMFLSKAFELISEWMSHK